MINQTTIKELQNSGTRLEVQDYAGFKEFYKAQIELENIELILQFLLNKNYDINSTNYKYYENQYLIKYLEHFYEKEKFNAWLINKIGTQVFWYIDFGKREAYYKNE